MKKQLLVLVCIIFFGNSLFAQFYAEADAVVVYPMESFSSFVKYGYGPSLNVGYSINDKLEVSVGYDYLVFNSLLSNLRIMSESLSFKYKFKLKVYTPYLGIKTGIYNRSRDVPVSVSKDGTVIVANKKDNAFGFAPQIGVLVDIGSSNKFKLNVATSYSTLLFDKKYKHISLNFGLQYLF